MSLLLLMLKVQQQQRGDSWDALMKPAHKKRGARGSFHGLLNQCGAGGDARHRAASARLNLPQSHGGRATYPAAQIFLKVHLNSFPFLHPSYPAQLQDWATGRNEEKWLQMALKIWG